MLRGDYSWRTASHLVQLPVEVSQADTAARRDTTPSAADQAVVNPDLSGEQRSLGRSAGDIPIAKAIVAGRYGNDARSRRVIAVKAEGRDLSIIGMRSDHHYSLRL